MGSLARKISRTKDKKRWKELKDLRIEYTNEKITDTCGLGSVLDIFHKSSLKDEFAKCLPTRVSSRSAGSYKLAMILMASFIYGHDSLDDLEEFRGDPYLEEFFETSIPAPRTMGDFLRDFTIEDINKLKEFLHKLSMSFRKQISKGVEKTYTPGPLTIDIDSTDHEQDGKKMEGLAWNYKDHWCLDSQVVFDELGFCHGAQLRPGNTESGVNAKELVLNSFKEAKFKEKKYLRADSAYLTREVIESSIAKGATFTITAHGNIGWRERINEVSEWTSWEYSEEEIKKHRKRKKELPRVETGRIYWSPSWAPTLKFPVVIKRTWEEGKQITLFEESKWNYYGVVTNFNLFENSYQKVLEHHQKRGNCENFIREEKYGYDLKHFPCQKLLANHAYQLIAMIAHNILRWVAIMTKPDKPHFSKKLRRKYIFIPGKVVEHARQLVLKIPVRFRKEVSLLKEALQATHIPAHEFS